MRMRTTRDRGGAVGRVGRDLSCLEVRPLLSALADGEGDDLLRARIDGHVRRCPRCREFEAFVRRSARLLRSEESSNDVDSAPMLTAAHLAHEVRQARVAGRRGAWRSSMVATVVAAALSIGMFIGGLGVWTLNQEQTTEGRLADADEQRALPRIVAVRTLDPDVSADDGASILIAWAPPRSVENTFDEKSMYWVTPMSHFERVHYLPDQL